MKRLLLVVMLITVSFFGLIAQQSKDYLRSKEIDPVVEIPLAGASLLGYSTDGYILQAADTLGNWRPNPAKFLYVRNSDNKIINYKHFVFLNSQWQILDGYECAYTVDSGVVKQTNVTYTTGTTLQYRTDYTYNNGKLANTFAYKKLNTYDKDLETYYSYSLTGHRIKDSTWKSWGTSIFYSYDVNNRCSLEVKRYNTPLSGVDTVSYNRYEYYQNGKLKKNILFEHISGKLRIKNAMEYAYTAGGSISTSTETVFDTNQNKSYIQAYYHYYNSNGKLISFARKAYDSAWNLLNIGDTIYFPVLSDGSYDTATRYLWVNNQWRANSRYIFDGALGTGTQAITAGNMSVFPNPASHQLTVELPENPGTKEIFITDITGKVIRQFPVNGPVAEIPLDIQPGVYFLHAGGYAAKFIKQ
ncbi:MAG TPA: T9SS type A sorting domain-containing protein [Bacteroidia bacterium]|nr:T9SS type A sorting domain-containing protein [Bacteroidia bacterium]